MMFSSVDFPQPDAPTMQAKLASGISIETWSIARTSRRRVRKTIETSLTAMPLIY
jgi:hypothetical protein